MNDEEMDRETMFKYLAEPFRRVIDQKPNGRLVQRSDPLEARQTFEVYIDGKVSTFEDFDEAVAAFNVDLKIKAEDVRRCVYEMIVPVASKDNTKRGENIQITWKISWPDLRVVFVVWEGEFGYNEFPTVEEAVEFYNAL